MLPNLTFKLDLCKSKIRSQKENRKRKATKVLSFLDSVYIGKHAIIEDYTFHLVRSLPRLKTAGVVRSCLGFNSK